MKGRCANLLVAFLTSALTGHAFAAPPKKPSPPTQIEGQVFIVTKGQQAIKLALVNVFVAREDRINRFLQSRVAAANETRRTIATALQELKADKDAAWKELQPELQKGASLRSAVVRALTTECTGPYSQCREVSEQRRQEAEAFDASIADLNKRHRDLQAAYEEAKARYDAAAAPNAIFDGFQDAIEPIAILKTDADGRFNLSVPSGARVALLAKANRQTMGDVEDYLWLVWVHPKSGSAKIGVTLANDNLFETACAECITYTSLIDNPPIE